MAKGIYRIGLSLKEVNDILSLNLGEIDLEELLKKEELSFKVVNSKETLISAVKSVIGKPYKRGASVLKDAPDEFDCSSLIAWAAVEAGLAIPRIAIDQYVYSERINESDLTPGDLVFTNTQEIIHTEGTYFSQVLNKEVNEESIRTETLEYKPGTQVPEGVDHVGMFIGEGKIIHASTKTGGVVEENLTESNSFKNIVGYGKIAENNEIRFVVEIPPEAVNLRKKEEFIKEIGKLWQILH